MFYISKVSFNKDKFGIIDSKDGVEEIYSGVDVIKIASKLRIEGLLVQDGVIKFAVPTTPDLVRLESSPIATPFRVKLNKNLDWKQCLYGGCVYDSKSKVSYKIIDETSGLSNYFILTNEYVTKHINDCKFDFENNNPVKVAELLRKVGR